MIIERGIGCRECTLGLRMCLRRDWEMGLRMMSLDGSTEVLWSLCVMNGDMVGIGRMMN